jgi:hypothetical protein
MIAISTSSFAQEKGNDETLREARGIFDLQVNTESNIEFNVTNYGIFGFNVANNGGTGGVFWPRGSQNLYTFGGGFWFGAKKEVAGEMRKLVSVSYNPNSGRSWFVPGRYEDGKSIDTNNYKKYRSYFSTDFKENGTPIFETDGPNWPLWITDPDKKYEFGVYSNEYIHEQENRTLENYPLGPLFHSDEHVFSTYKDSDLLFYEGGTEQRSTEGYPLGLQVEENIYTWKDGEMKDVMIITYKIKNVSDDELKECWFAPINDFDITKAVNSAYGAGNDRINYYMEDDKLNLVYAWSDTDRGEEGEGFGYIGFSMLETPAVDHEGYIRNDKYIYDPNEQIGLTTFRNWPIQDDRLTNTDRYEFLSSKIIDGDTGPGDKRLMMATGPFNMKPGDEARLAIGITFSMPAKGGEADGTYEDITGLTGKQVKNNDKTQAEKNSLIGLQELTKENYYQLLSTSVEEIEIDNSFVSPNPADDYILINPPKSPFGKGGSEFTSRGISEIEIYNILGEKVISQSILPMNSSLQINVEELPPGMYFIKIGDRVEKFVKE